MARILIVDDNQQNLYLLQTLLQGHGHDVVCAQNGAQALELARQSPPDVVVTDVLMPEMDGFALCRAWKSDEILKQSPVVVYTATYTDPRDEELAVSLGADCFVTKPAKPLDLLKSIEDLLAAEKTQWPGTPHEIVDDDTSLLKQYNQVLVRKLEDKLLELEAANQELRQTIAELDEAHEGLRVQERALEATPTGILITDPTQPDNPIVSCNAAFERITGYSRSEVLGRNCRFLQGSETGQGELSTLRAAIREERECEVVLRNFRKDGSPFLNRLSISPVRNSAGVVTHFVGVQEDITSRRKIEEALQTSEALLRSVANEVPHALLVVGNQGDSIEFFNRQFLELWDVMHLADAIASRELAGRDLISCCLSQLHDVAAFVSPLKSLWRSGEPESLDDELLLNDGRVIRRFCTRIANETGKNSLLLCMFEDVTERKQQELQEREQAIALARIHTLSVRQREVLVLLAEGMPNKAIASRLGVSERTVEKHRSNLMRTLQLDNIPDLIRLYLAAGADTVTLVHA